MVREYSKLCPKCGGSGSDSYGWECNLCNRAGSVAPFRMSKPCPKCGAMEGFIKRRGPNNVAHCATTGCWFHVYCPPKTETGESVRSINSRPDLSTGTRHLVLSRANCRCELCGRGAETVLLQVAHALSVADCRAQDVPEGEWNDPSNLLAACEECNHDMGARSLEPRQMARLLIARLSRGRAQR